MNHIPKPGYVRVQPEFKTIAGIKDTIGLQDSCIQTSEISVRFFEEEAGREGNIEEFVKAMGRKFKISVGTADLEYFKSIQYKSYIPRPTI
jgi:hypothetical protein